MEVSFMKEKDWEDFREQFPSAYHFILHRCLVGEYASLKRMKTRSQYHQRRFEELDRLYQFWKSVEEQNPEKN